MSGPVEDPLECEAVQEELVELSLGTLSGRVRSEVLGHVEGCAQCSAELEQLSVVSDALLQLAPRIQPPVGFELRLAERLRAPESRRPRRARRLGVLCAAAVFLVVLGFSLGALVTPGGGAGRGRSETANLTAANLTSHGHVLGEVMISAGQPAWVFMTINGSAWPRTVRCDLTLAGGRVETIGSFQLSGEYGAWGAPLTSAARQVRSARIIAPDGTILASAQVRM